MRNTAQHYSKKSNGFTLIELILVTAIIGVITVPFIITYRNSRANQALRTSAEQVADHARSAHVFAREANEGNGWGITSTDDSSYAIVSGTETDWNEFSSYVLQPQITFTNDFFVWFEIGTGAIDSGQTIELSNLNGTKSKVDINENGVVEVTNE